MSVQVKGSWLYWHEVLMLVMRSLFDQKSYDCYSIVCQEKETGKYTINTNPCIFVVLQKNQPPFNFKSLPN